MACDISSCRLTLPTSVKMETFLLLTSSVAGAQQGWSYICQSIWHEDHQLIPAVMQTTGRNKARLDHDVVAFCSVIVHRRYAPNVSV